MADLSDSERTPIRRILSPDIGDTFYESLVTVSEVIDYATIHTAKQQRDLPNPGEYPSQSPPLLGIAESTQTHFDGTDIAEPTVHINTGTEWQDTFLTLQNVASDTYTDIIDLQSHSDVELNKHDTYEELAQEVSHTEHSVRSAINSFKGDITAQFTDLITNLKESTGRTYVKSEKTVGEKIDRISEKIDKIHENIQDPFYDVTILSTSLGGGTRSNPAEMPPDQTLKVTAAVENTGHKRGESQTVNFLIDGKQFDSQTLSNLYGTVRATDSGITTHTENIDIVTFAWTPSSDDTGSHTLTVQTDDDTAERSIDVLEQPFYAVDIDTDSLPDAVQPGTAVDLDVTVTNTGEMSEAQVITLQNSTEITYDDSTEPLPSQSDLDSKSVRVDGGDSTEITLRWRLDTAVDPQSVDLLVKSFDSSDTTSLTIEPVPPTNRDNFNVSIDEVTQHPVEGEIIDVDFTVTNTGDETATKRVTLSAGDKQRDSRKITLESGDSASPNVEFSHPEFEITTIKWEDSVPDSSLVGIKKADVTVTNSGPDSGDAELYLIHPVTRKAIDNVPITDLSSQEKSGEYTLTWEIESREIGGTHPIEVQVWEDKGVQHDVDIDSVEIPEPGFELSFERDDIQSRFDDTGNHLEVSPTVGNTGYAIGDAEVYLKVDGEYVDHQVIADMHPRDGREDTTLTWGGAALGETHDITVEVHDTDGVEHDRTTREFETPTFSIAIIETPTLGMSGDTETVGVSVTNESTEDADGTVTLTVDDVEMDSTTIESVAPAESVSATLEWEVSTELPEEYSQTVAASIDDNTTTEGVSVFHKIYHGIGHVGRYDHEENIQAWGVNLDKLDRDDTEDTEYSDERTWEYFDENSQLINAQASAVPTDKWPMTSGARIGGFRENEDGDRELYGLNSVFEGEYNRMWEMPVAVGTTGVNVLSIAGQAAAVSFGMAAGALVVAGVLTGTTVGITELVYAVLPDREGETDQWMNLTWVQGDSDFSFAYENITMQFTLPSRRDRQTQTTYVGNFFRGFDDDEHRLIHASTRAPPSAGDIPESVGSRVVGIDNSGVTTVDREIAVAKGSVDEFISGMWVPKSAKLPGEIKHKTIKIGTHGTDQFKSDLEQVDSGPTYWYDTRRKHDAKAVSLSDYGELDWNPDNVIISATVDYIPTLKTEFGEDSWTDETAARLSGISEDHTEIGYEVAVAHGIVEVYLNLTWLEVD